MRILVDQNLPRSLATRLALAGHDAVHTSDEGLERATDPVVFTACINQDRVLVTGDKKLTKFLAASSAVARSVIIVRGFGGAGLGPCRYRNMRGSSSGMSMIKVYGPFMWG